MPHPDRPEDATATDTSQVFEQAQDGDAGQVSKAGLYPTLDADEARTAASEESGGRGSGDADDDQAPIDQDDPELSGADLDEDQSDGRGPTIQPGA